MSDSPKSRCREDVYILGTSEEELERLGFQHCVWSEQAFALWERAGFRPGHTILDVGCGPGYATMDLATLVGPEGKILSIDASEKFLAYLREQQEKRGLTNIETMPGDVQEFELREHSIDGAYTRWVLCYLEHPDEVVKRVAHALKPGGTFAVQDYFNLRTETLAPRHPAIDRVFEALAESWRQTGGNPDIAGELPLLFEEAGLEEVEMTSHVRVGHPGSLVWRWIETCILSACSDTLVEMELLSEEEYEEFVEVWEMYSKEPTTFVCSAPVIDIIGRKRA